MFSNAVLYFLPLKVITKMVMKEFVDPNDKSLNYLYDSKMITREDPNTDVYLKEYYVP